MTETSSPVLSPLVLPFKIKLCLVTKLQCFKGQGATIIKKYFGKLNNTKKQRQPTKLKKKKKRF